MPSGARRSRVAKVAQKDLWDSPAENALYFHARYVKPSWNRAARRHGRQSHFLSLMPEWSRGGFPAFA
jgi:hypothetical protein